MGRGLKRRATGREFSNGYDSFKRNDLGSLARLFADGRERAAL